MHRSDNHAAENEIERKKNHSTDLLWSFALHHYFIFSQHLTAKNQFHAFSQLQDMHKQNVNLAVLLFRKVQIRIQNNIPRVSSQQNHSRHAKKFHRNTMKNMVYIQYNSKRP